MEGNNSSSESEASELSLSCGSSPFEDGEEIRQPESESEAASDVRDPGEQILPYQFEPYLSMSEDSHGSQNESDDNGEEENRMIDNSWCRCGHCQVMPTAIECVCCAEIDKVVNVRDEFPECQCITDHQGFHPVCLDIHVLRVAYYQYRQQFGDRPEQNNERHRYTAYRQFVRWCWHFLGKEVRVVIPACVVLKIRSSYPDPAQNYTGFQEADTD